MPLVNADRMMLSILPDPGEDGHLVPWATTLRRRFPRTQKAISEAIHVADASIMTDNGRSPSQAFTVCRVQVNSTAVYDIREGGKPVPDAIAAWMSVVCPMRGA